MERRPGGNPQPSNSSGDENQTAQSQSVTDTGLVCLLMLARFFQVPVNT